MPQQRTRSNTLTSLLAGNNRIVPAELSPEFFTLLSQKLQPHWIERTFFKLECTKFIALDAQDTQGRCVCGRLRNQHGVTAALGRRFNSVTTNEGSGNDEPNNQTSKEQRWSIKECTNATSTDAFGIVEFQGGPHPHKAQYVRLAFDSTPDDMMELFDKVWKLPPPTLVITVHGGFTNFDLNAKLTTAFRKGLMKAAKTTGAWIITNGINAGVVRHVSAALADSFTSRSRSKITSIGIASWGIIKKREDLVGRDVTVPYHPQAFSPKGRLAVLNDKHKYFLLVDNGTVGRFGADIILRKRLEEHIARKRTIGQKGKRRVPVVCVVLEGGTCTIRSVLDYVTNDPPVPVVVIEGLSVPGVAVSQFC